MQAFQFHRTDNVVTCTLMINDKVMKTSIFRIQLFSDTVIFRSYGLCQRAGRVGVDLTDKFHRKSWEG